MIGFDIKKWYEMIQEIQKEGEEINEIIKKSKGLYYHNPERYT